MDLASVSLPVAKPEGPLKALKPPQRRGTAARPPDQQAPRAERCGITGKVHFAGPSARISQPNRAVMPCLPVCLPCPSRLPAMEGRAPSVLNNTKTKLRNALKELHLNVAMQTLRPV
jgi:hypothetical protein